METTCHSGWAVWIWIYLHPSVPHLGPISTSDKGSRGGPRKVWLGLTGEPTPQNSHTQTHTLSPSPHRAPEVIDCPEERWLALNGLLPSAFLGVSPNSVTKVPLGTLDTQRVSVDREMHHKLRGWLTNASPPNASPPNAGGAL